MRRTERRVRDRTVAARARARRSPPGADRPPRAPPFGSDAPSSGRAAAAAGLAPLAPLCRRFGHGGQARLLRRRRPRGRTRPQSTAPARRSRRRARPRARPAPASRPHRDRATREACARARRCELPSDQLYREERRIAAARVLPRPVAILPPTYFSIALFPAPPIVIFFGFCSAGFRIRSSSTPSW